ncbi:MAG: hypothetical protein WDN69_26090 [Aliidongia sp.]
MLGFAKVTRDITAQRKAQQLLEHAREALFQSQKMDASRPAHRRHRT